MKLIKVTNDLKRRIRRYLTSEFSLSRTELRLIESFLETQYNSYISDETKLHNITEVLSEIGMTEDEVDHLFFDEPEKKRVWTVWKTWTEFKVIDGHTEEEQPLEVSELLGIFEHEEDARDLQEKEVFTQDPYFDEPSYETIVAEMDLQ